MTFRPDVTVAAIVQRDSRFLCVEETAAGRLVINQPAGHLEAGESLVEAAVRETLEETAWHVTVNALSGIYLWQNPVCGRAYLRVSFVASCRAHDGDRSLDEGIERALWLTRDEIAAAGDRLRSPMVLRSVDDYLAGQRYPLDLLNHLDQDELPSVSVSLG